jgi:hypothetical protein
MVFNATFNNISVISRRSVLFVEETGQNHRPVAQLPFFVVVTKCLKFVVIVKCK